MLNMIDMIERKETVAKSQLIHLEQMFSYISMSI